MMVSKWLYLCFFLVISFQSIGQYSDSPRLEKDVKEILRIIKLANSGEESQENSGKLRKQAIQKSYETLDKYDLSCDQKGRLFLKIGSVHYDSYEDNKAISILRDSVLGNWIDCPGLEQKWLWDPAVLLFDLYILHNRLIDAEKIYQFIESKPLITKDVNPSRIQEYYSTLGAFAAEINDKTLSMQSLKKATKLLEEVKDSTLTFGVHNEFANSLNRLGDVSNSIIQYEKALKFANTEISKITAIVNYTEILLQNGDVLRADSLLNTISEIVLKHDEFYRYKTIYLQRMATLKNKKGAYEDAISYMKDSNKELKDNEDAFVSRAVNLSIMASSYYGLKDITTGDKVVSSAINMLLATNEKVDINKGESFKSYVSYNFRELLNILENLGEEKLKMQNLDNALFVINEIQQLIDHNKQKLSGESSKIFQTTSLYPLYEKAISAFVKQFEITNDESYLDQAIQLSLINKGNILANNINENQIYKTELPTEAYEKLKRLEFNKNSSESEVVNVRAKALDSLNNIYFSSLSRYNLFKDSLLEIHTGILPKLNKNIVDFSVNEIEEYLGNDKAYLELFEGQKMLYLFCLSKGNKAVFKVDLTNKLKNEFDSYSNDLYNYISSDGFYERSKNMYSQLYQSPFDHFEKLGIDKVIASSDGAFHMIPLETFWDGESFLVEKFDVSYILSNSQLIDSKREYSDDYLGFGTAYSKDLNSHILELTGKTDLQLSALQLAEKEIESGKGIMGGEIYLGKNATKNNFLKSSASNSGIIHLALHGIILYQNNSGLLFHDDEEQCILDHLDLGMLDLKNELTLLSACHSGSGEVFKGEGLRSLARSFLYAGSKSVVSSLWAASDISNEEIMTGLLVNISEGQGAHAALNVAKRDYLEKASPSFKHPAYWGNMVYIGASEKSVSYSLWYWILGLGILGILLLLYWKKRG